MIVVGHEQSSDPLPEDWVDRMLDDYTTISDRRSSIHIDL